MVECAHCKAELPEHGAACPHCGQPSLAEPDELLGTSVLGRYRIVRMLAEGGMGRVYLAEQAVGTVLRRVAIKVLRKQLGLDRQLVARFSREAETLVRLTHPNTVQLFDFGALPDGTLALVMEYVEGHSLARELLKGALSVPRAERVLTQVCGALHEAHAHGIVHRDLKPENLLIADRVGHGDFIKVLDFGIAKVSAEDPAASTKLTQQGMMIGTPPYMSPEQFSGEPVDARSDIYSLGVIAFELLTGKLPFDAKTPWEWASKHLTTVPEELPIDGANGLGVSHALAIRCALAKRASDRPQTVAEFLDVFTGRGSPAASALGSRGQVSRSAATFPVHERVLDSPIVRPRARFDAQPHPTHPTTHAANTHSGAGETGSRSRRTVLFAATIGIALLLAVFALGRGSRGAVADRPVVSVASLPTVPDAPPVVLPVGAALPPESDRRSRAEEPRAATQPAPGTSREPHPARARAASQRRESEPARTRATSSESAPAPMRTETGALAGAVSPPAASARTVAPPGTSSAASSERRPPTEQARPAAPRPAAASGETASVKAGAISPDLQQRVDQIRAASASRVETAVGLYQAAASRYGLASALIAVRGDLARGGEKRISELLKLGRCAQAQALLRALRATGANLAVDSGFGPSCPRP